MEKKDIDFSNKNPNEPLTDFEMENFEEGMKLKSNPDHRPDEIDFKRAVESVIEELDDLFS